MSVSLEKGTQYFKYGTVASFHNTHTHSHTIIPSSEDLYEGGTVIWCSESVCEGSVIINDHSEVVMNKTSVKVSHKVSLSPGGLRSRSLCLSLRTFRKFL